MRRSFLPGLCLVCMLVTGGPSFAQKIVLNIDGNWWDSSGQALGFASSVNGPCVFGDRGSLEVADPDYGKPMNFKDLWHNGAMKNRS